MYGHTHTHTHTYAQAINQTVISQIDPPLPLLYSNTNPLIKATITSEWWALRVTGQRPHEKTVCLRGTEQEGHQVHHLNKGMATSSHAHTNILKGLGGGVQIQSARDKRMIIRAHVVMQTEDDTVRLQSSIMLLSVRSHSDANIDSCLSYAKKKGNILDF